MPPSLPQRRRLTCRLAAAAACALAAGCAGLPRIDPTGERVLIWPKDQPVAATAPLTGNYLAPPVGTDPVFPAQAAAPLGPPVAAVAAPAPVVAPVAVAQPPGDRFFITPERILAPVNSEVVLKSAICTTEGYTLADQKVEWMLGRNGVGEFVEVGGKGLLHPPLISFLRGQKVDNYLARGYTANGPLCLDRGTVDPSDDVNITRGDAWVSVTSANEGTSYVTAYTPAVDSWPDRRSAATIYWVDVQWVFPPASVASSGRGETLTTTVTRQTNGTPIEGWIVRYTVNDGARLSGPGSGQVVDVRTGPDGRASVQVSPTASGAASSQIDAQLIRPPGFGGGDAPQLVIGSSSSVIQWGGSSPYLPPSTASPLPATPIRPVPGAVTPLPGSSGPPTPMPQLPGNATIPTTPTPNTPPPGAGASIPNIPQAQARLEVEIRGNNRADVGGQVTFEVTIRNTGDAPATNVVLNDQYQTGLSHPADLQGTRNIQKRLGTIAPRESRVERLTFNVQAAGRLYHDVTVTYAEGTAAAARSYVDAAQTAPQRTAAVKVEKDGPLEGTVGQPVLFKVTVKNTGETPLVNIQLIDEYPATLQVRPEPNVQVVSGRIVRRIDRLEVGQSRSFEVTCVCLQPTREAYTLASVEAQSDPPSGSVIKNADDHKLEIRPPRTAQARPGEPRLVSAVGASAGTLRVETLFFNRPARAGARATCQITVANLSDAPDEQIQLRVVFPAELKADPIAAQAPPNVRPELVGNELRFTPIAMLRPGEKASYLIPMNATQPGVVEVVVHAESRNSPQPGVSKTDSLEILSR